MPQNHKSLIIILYLLGFSGLLPLRALFVLEVVAQKCVKVLPPLPPPLVFLELGGFLPLLYHLLYVLHLLPFQSFQTFFPDFPRILEPVFPSVMLFG